MLTDRELDHVLAGGIPEGFATPQTLVEAVMYSVCTRGLAALDEPATLERLSRCDEAARQQINDRIAALIAGGRLKGAADAAA